MRFRGKSVRRGIVALLLVPLVSLTAIWAFAATITSRGVYSLLAVHQMTDKIGYPLENAIVALGDERRAAMVRVADPRGAASGEHLRTAVEATDRALAALAGAAADPAVRGNLDPESLRRLTALADRAGALQSLRHRLDQGRLTLDSAFTAYNAEIDPYFTFFLGLPPVPSAELDRQTGALIQLSRAREYIAREDALYTAAEAAGSMSPADQRLFGDAVAGERLLYQTYPQLLPDSYRQLFATYWATGDGHRLRTAEDRITGADAAGPRGPQRLAGTVAPVVWQATATSVLGDLDSLSRRATEDYKDRVQPFAEGVLLEAGLAGGFGLLAVIASVVVSLRIGRRVARDLTALRTEALEASGTRLPQVLRRLASGEQVDVETEVPRLDYAEDEFGEVGRALNALQRAAVEAAVRQADMRRGISDVFVNLARRSQVLLHRQLALLDAMERRTESAEELADLFRLDHMTTRMRRHAEGLVILSGASPSRQWRRPVRLMDVVRAAVAEVEDYERVEVRRLPRLSVAGTAVGDITHLLAELIENATVFSPPHTSVRVHGERTAGGFALEVDDRGLGMTADALLDANLRLAETPEFELSDTDRLGLFVVSRLARRQGVRVTLRPSPYGGTTAVVLLPNALLIEDGEDSSATGGTPLPDQADRAAAERPEPAGTGPGGEYVPRSFRDWGLLPGDLGEETPGAPVVLRSRFDAGRRGEEYEEHQPAGEPQAPDASGHLAGNPPPGPRSSPVLVSDHGRPVDRARRHRGGTPPPAAAPEGQAAGGADAGHADAGHADEGQAGGPSGGLAALPRRVRQASLVPQLREDGRSAPDASRQTQAREPQPDDERDAEEVRSRMAAMQRGWQRGRAEADDLAAPDGPGGRSGKVTATTSEGDGP